MVQEQGNMSSSSRRSEHEILLARLPRAVPNQITGFRLLFGYHGTPPVGTHHTLTSPAPGGEIVWG